VSQPARPGTLPANSSDHNKLRRIVVNSGESSSVAEKRLQNSKHVARKKNFFVEIGIARCSFVYANKRTDRIASSSAIV